LLAAGVAVTALLLLALLCAQAPPAARAQSLAGSIAIQAGSPGAAIPPTLFGIFFEDINFAADGGLYPELVKNRVLRANDLGAENSLDQPDKVPPVESRVAPSGDGVDYTLPSWSVIVLRAPMR
jgi:hypothetical protein